MNTRMGKLAFRLSVLGLVVVLVAAGGCGKKDTRINPELAGDGDGSGGSGIEETNSSGLPDIDQGSILWDKATGLQDVYFDYDSFSLRADAIATLNANADKIKQVPTALIQIEGHCDERGTQEYNLTLGEKRALAVRDYLMKLGISGDRLVTISYGEERPAVDGHDESAWSRNRRSEFNKAVR